MIKKSLLLGSAIALFACAAHADVLWSQPYDGGSSFFASQNDTAKPSCARSNSRLRP